MPLMGGKSKKAFSKNVETEMDSGKPQKQSLAIAYAVQRKPKKKMASGGQVDGQRVEGMEDDQSSGMGLYAPGGLIRGDQDPSSPSTPSRKPDDSRRPMDDYMASQSTGESPMDEDTATGIIDAIRTKMEMQKDSQRDQFAEGGKIPGGYDEGNIDWENGQSPYDDDNSDAYKKELYDDSQLSRQPHDSNLTGDDREMSSENEHDMSLVDRIRERMRNRRGF